MKQISLVLFIALLTFTCSTPEEEKVYADLIIEGGPIYTVSDAGQVEAVAVSGNTILFAGTKELAEQYKGENTETIDLAGKTMVPGLIEGHGHFMGYGYSKLNVELQDVKSYEELVEKVKAAVDKAEPGEWVVGRGWHQDKWTSKPEKMIRGFQTHELLSEATPDNPVVLYHASGHASFANEKAMEVAGVLPLSTEAMVDLNVEGGEIIRDELGNPTGIFNERAMQLIRNKVEGSKDKAEQDRKAFELAQKFSHMNGITSFHDAGIGRDNIALFQKMKEEGKLKIRIYAMLTGWDRELLNEWYDKGIMVDSTHWFTIRSIKLNCDGALGSRGAWLLEEYTDSPGHFGHETLPMEFVAETSVKGLENGFQVCSHAIGDRANREILDRYEAAFKQLPEKADDHRFRIEHAQHLHPEDIPRFGELGVIPAMQAIHMSSDRPWAIDRLGEERIVNGAYVWRSLIDSGAVIVNGTDVPVEPIDPLPSFYASITRQTLEGTPEGGYEPEQQMTREEALESYTINAAYGAFEEDIKGSIEPGKLADFTILSKDIMTIPELEILETDVMMTIVDGQIVYERVENL